MSLLAELRRRNVIRMAGLYLVGAWLLVQVASTLMPAFSVPGWALRALVMVLALGFAPGEENFAKLQRFLSRDIDVRFESLEDSMDKHVNGSNPVISLRSQELAAYRKDPRYLHLLHKAGFDDAGDIQ